jgi:hypothetical protein
MNGPRVLHVSRQIQHGAMVKTQALQENQHVTRQFETHFRDPSDHSADALLGAGPIGAPFKTYHLSEGITEDEVMD